MDHDDRKKYDPTFGQQAGFLLRVISIHMSVLKSLAASEISSARTCLLARSFPMLFRSPNPSCNIQAEACSPPRVT
jgi:hypothetical protein